MVSIDPNNDPKVSIFLYKKVEDNTGEFKHGKNDKIQRIFFQKIRIFKVFLTTYIFFLHV